jgi:hypothetical protein
MELPFSREQFFELFAAYNQTLWPAAVALWLLSAWACTLRRSSSPQRHRWMSAVLALHWAWSGLAYHAWFFTRINPAAWAFAAAFLLQSGLLWRAGSAHERIELEGASSRWSAAGWAFIGYALLYPAVNVVEHGVSWRTPAFGVPCPTTIFTAGVLLLGTPAWSLSAIPILWSVIGGAAALLLGVSADYALPLAGLALTGFCLGRRPVPAAA